MTASAVIPVACLEEGAAAEHQLDADRFTADRIESVSLVLVLGIVGFALPQDSEVAGRTGQHAGHLRRIEVVDRRDVHHRRRDSHQAGAAGLQVCFRRHRRK
ncbi:hypothetical protein [Streptomyces sp. NPDC051704]|uniref:hypothetical protein n=1 Tax=Streptomyces sp. NPDC051704 TaxID=3365671 RepID=UPI0037B6B03A